MAAAQGGTARPRTRTLADILKDPSATMAPEAVIPRFAFAGRVTLLSAREKAGKSTIASAGAAAVSTGGQFLGEMVKAGPVLWLMLEEHVGDLALRFQGFGAEGDRVHILEVLERPLADLRAAVEQTGATLVVLDTLAAFAETLVRDASSSTEWTPVMGGLARIARDTNVAILVLHHARKDGGYRDSTAIGAGVDLILELTTGDEAAIRQVKGRGRWGVEDFSVRLEDGVYTMAAGEMSLDARVLVFVKSNPGCSMRALRDGVKGKAETITATVATLLKTGALEDRGTDAARRLYPQGWEPPSDRSGSREKPNGTAEEPLSGTAAEGGRFPDPMPREPDWEPPSEWRDQPPLGSPCDGCGEACEDCFVPLDRS